MPDTRRITQCFVTGLLLFLQAAQARIEEEGEEHQTDEGRHREHGQQHERPVASSGLDQDEGAEYQERGPNPLQSARLRLRRCRDRRRPTRRQPAALPMR